VCVGGVEVKETLVGCWRRPEAKSIKTPVVTILGNSSVRINDDVGVYMIRV